MAPPAWQSGASPGLILLIIIVIVSEWGIGIRTTLAVFFNPFLGKTLNFTKRLGVKYGIGIRMNLILLIIFGIEFCSTRIPCSESLCQVCSCHLAVPALVYFDHPSVGRTFHLVLHNLIKFHRDRFSRLREKYNQHLYENNNNEGITIRKAYCMIHRGGQSHWKARCRGKRWPDRIWYSCSGAPEMAPKHPTMAP